MQLQCSKCREFKSVDDFYVDSSKTRGRSYYCRRCVATSSRGARRRARDRESIPCAGECGRSVWLKKNSSGRCIRCYNASRAGSGSSRTPTNRGYVTIQHEGRACLEHRVLMEEHLGRKLVRGENVHHKNGKRNDNRLSNLELWVSHQPSGQRPADLVQWAYEILDRYEAFEQPV